MPIALVCDVDVLGGDTAQAKDLLLRIRRRVRSHNRGCAVDLSMYELKTGKPVSMPSVYDEMTDRAYPDYAGGTAEQRWNRSVLREAMEKQGFVVNKAEWWHFDYKDWKMYPIGTARFEDLESSALGAT